MVRKALQVQFFDEEIAWNTEQDAVVACIDFCCIVCSDNMTFSIEKDGLGRALSSTDKELKKHISRLEEKYNAKEWCTEKRCINNHNQNLIFIFGETQPARYVLVKAAIAKN